MKVTGLLLLFGNIMFAQNEQIKRISCDTILPEKGYSVSLKYDASNESWDETIPNMLFSFSHDNNGSEKNIYQEKLFSQFKNVEFEDFNGDGVKDILIENISDVRSNLTYNLFLVDLKNQKLIKIEGFNEIKNPNYLSKYNLIDCMVMSGQNWTSFYKIENNKVKDFGYTIKMGEDENGRDYDYDKNYNKILKNILKSEKKQHKRLEIAQTTRIRI